MTDQTNASIEAPHDYRIGAITEALLEGNELWAAQGDDGMVLDIEAIAIIAVQVVERLAEEDTDGTRECRHACHAAEQETNVATIREWGTQTDNTIYGEDIVLRIMETP